MLQTIQPFLGIFQTILVSNESMHCKTLNAFARSEFKSSLAYRRITDKSQSIIQATLFQLWGAKPVFVNPLFP